MMHNLHVLYEPHAEHLFFATTIRFDDMKVVICFDIDVREDENF